MTLRYRMMAAGGRVGCLPPPCWPRHPSLPKPLLQPGGRGGGGAGRGGGRRGGFTQFTRPLASQDVLARGKALYETNCASCHAADLRGAPTGTNLLRSGIALNDQHGELVGKAVADHKPKINLVETDAVAVAEYIHSILATTGGQGSPPGRNPVGMQLNILVGDAKAGEAYFAKGCASCHSVTGDLKGSPRNIPIRGHCRTHGWRARRRATRSADAAAGARVTP